MQDRVHVVEHLPDDGTHTGKGMVQQYKHGTAAEQRGDQQQRCLAAGEAGANPLFYLLHLNTGLFRLSNAVSSSAGNGRLK